MGRAFEMEINALFCHNKQKLESGVMPTGADWIEPQATNFNLVVAEKWHIEDWDKQVLRDKRPGTVALQALKLGATEEQLRAAALLLL